jgi:hypothetical protein
VAAEPGSWRGWARAASGILGATAVADGFPVPPVWTGEGLALTLRRQPTGLAAHLGNGVAGASTMTTKSTWERSQPPTQQTRQPSMR